MIQIKKTKTVFLTVIISLVVLFAAVVVIILKRGEAGTLGDAFNGLTAPFIALISAALLYTSFMAQLRANKLLQGQWTFDTYLRLFDDIKTGFDKIKVKYDPRMPGSDVVRYGKEAFGLIFTKHKDYIYGASDAFLNLVPLLEEFGLLISAIHTAEFEQKQYLLFKIIRFHELNFKGIGVRLLEPQFKSTEGQREEALRLIRGLNKTLEKIAIKNFAMEKARHKQEAKN